MAERVRIIIADDHMIFRTGLRIALTSAEACEVIEAPDYDALLHLLERVGRPDVVILDLNMPGFVRGSGILTLRGRLPSIPILILSASEAIDDVLFCLSAGASGYICKAADIATVHAAIRTVRSGGIYVPRELMAGTIPVGTLNGKMPGAHRGVPGLTRRQVEVLQLASDGHANKEIAFRLGISEGTVKAHMAGVMRTLGVHNRVQMLREAERQHLLS